MSKNWAGNHLKNIETVANFIRNATTKTGLSVHASIDTKEYNIGIKILKDMRHKISLVRKSFEGIWNYIIKPNKHV